MVSNFVCLNLNLIFLTLFLKDQPKNFSDSFKLENLDIKMLVESKEFPELLIFPCSKGTTSKEEHTLIVQYTNDYLSRTFFHDNEVDLDEDAIKAGDFCVWDKLEFKSVI